MVRTDIEVNIKAVDNASATMRNVGVSTKDLALAFNNVATSAFGFYNIIDNVLDRQVAVDRANLQVKKSLQSVDDAQEAYNKTIEKFGINSDEAKDAQTRLQLAEESYQVATERADMLQGNLNETIVRGALQVIPTAITMISSIGMITTNWTQATQGISSAMTFLAANPIVLVIAGVAALVIGLIYLYNTCEPVRNALNTIGAVLSGAVMTAVNAVIQAVTWLWNNVLVPVGQFIIGSFLAAWNGISAFWAGVVVPVINAVRDAIGWLWNNVLVPLASFLIGGLLASWQAMCTGISWAYDNIVKPVIDAFGAGISWLADNVFGPALGAMSAAWSAFCGAFVWFYNNVIKPVIDAIAAAFGWISGIFAGGGEVNPEAGGARERAPEESYKPSEPSEPGGKRGQFGGIISGPTWLLAGEAGPEALVPLDRYNLGPSVNIEISSPLVYVQGSADRATAEAAARMVMQGLKSVIVEPTSIGAATTQKRIRKGALM
jgi:hypothetical protein